MWSKKSRRFGNADGPASGWVLDGPRPICRLQESVGDRCGSWTGRCHGKERKKQKAPNLSYLDISSGRSISSADLIRTERSRNETSSLWTDRICGCFFNSLNLFFKVKNKAIAQEIRVRSMIRGRSFPEHLGGKSVRRSLLGPGGGARDG